jgi:hypothetical protein
MYMLSALPWYAKARFALIKYLNLYKSDKIQVIVYQQIFNVLYLALIGRKSLFQPVAD